MSAGILPALSTADFSPRHSSLEFLGAQSYDIVPKNFRWRSSVGRAGVL
jgi:hypothetical protein